MIWTAEMEKALRQMLELDANLSYTLVADRMSVFFKMIITKNMCIGKARRMGIPQRKGKPQKADPRPVRGVLRMTRPEAPIPPPIESDEPLDGITLQQLRNGQCHFPLAKLYDKPPYVYCGEVTVGSTSWCHHHYARVHTAPRKTWT